MSVRPLVLQQDWGSLPVLRVRKTAGRFGLLLLPLALLLVPAAAWAAPATEADMSLYTRISALNVCISRSAGIDFDKSVAVAGETLAQVIQGQHDGVIQQVGNAFGKVNDAFSYLIERWTDITELRSIYKRLSEFEKALA